MTDQKSHLDWDGVRGFAAQMLNDLGAVTHGALIYLGDQLGIFKAMAAAGPITSVELAARTGLSERYLREWLASMAAAGYVEYAAERARFTLSPEHAQVLADEDSPFFMGGFITMIAPNFAMIPKIAEAFRTGKGVAQSEYPPETFAAIERTSAGIYRHQLIRHWMPAMPDVQHILEAGGDVLDVGCGAGRAVLTLAGAFPKARFFGYDAHPGSVERARQNARAAGVAERVSFDTVDCARLPSERFDLITTFDVIHDSGDPAGLMRSIRGALRPEGIYLMLEMNASANVEDNLNPKGRLMYSMSTLYCMSVSLAGGGPGIGTLMGEPKARELAAAAGFTRFRRLPIDDLFSALYEIRR